MKFAIPRILLIIFALVLAGCSGAETESAGTGPAEPAPSAVLQDEADPASESTGSPAGEEAAEPVPDIASEAGAAAETLSEAVASAVEEAAARIEVAATVPGATRIGAAKCKMCHKIQYDSWAESSHAGQDPVLDCESCHGLGSLYKKKSVMENRDLAVAAGLVLPEAGFCQRCHTDDWDGDMLANAHEHKQAP